MKLRESFNERYGKEYLALSPEELQGDLAKRDLSPAIQKKITAIVDYYRTLS